MKWAPFAAPESAEVEAWARYRARWDEAQDVRLAKWAPRTMLHHLRLAILDYYQAPRFGMPATLKISQQKRLFESCQRRTLRGMSLENWCRALAIKDSQLPALFLRTDKPSQRSRSKSGASGSWWPLLVQRMHEGGPLWVRRLAERSHHLAERDLARDRLTDYQAG